MLFSLSCSLGNYLTTGNSTKYWVETCVSNIMPVNRLKSFNSCFGSYDGNISNPAMMIMSALGY